MFSNSLKGMNLNFWGCEIWHSKKVTFCILNNNKIRFYLIWLNHQRNDLSIIPSDILSSNPYDDVIIKVFNPILCWWRWNCMWCNRQKPIDQQQFDCINSLPNCFCFYLLFWNGFIYLVSSTPLHFIWVPLNVFDLKWYRGSFFSNHTNLRLYR